MEPSEDYQKSTSHQLATLADRNVLQLEFLEQNVSSLQMEKENLVKEIVQLQKKVQHSGKTVEDGLAAQSNLKSNINQLKQDVLMKKHNHSVSSLAVSNLHDQVHKLKDSIARQRSDFIESYKRSNSDSRSFTQVNAMLPTELMDKLISVVDQLAEKHLLNSKIASEFRTTFDLYEKICIKDVHTGLASSDAGLDDRKTSQ